MKVSLEINGHEELSRRLKDKVNMSDVKRVVRHNGMRLNQNMVQKANFVKGYQTGTTKRSIHMDMSDGGLSVTVAPSTHYSQYLEYGTRFMEAQPFVGPSFRIVEGQFIRDMKRLMK